MGIVVSRTARRNEAAIPGYRSRKGLFFPLYLLVFSHGPLMNDWAGFHFRFMAVIASI